MGAITVTRPNDPVDEGNMPGFLFVALRSDLALSPPQEHPAIMARFNAIRTRADGSQYFAGVQAKVQAARITQHQRQSQA
jgi:phospholipase C